MQYFKHFTKMRNDTKLKRVFNRYGIEGYGIYCLILEHITEDLCTESAIPELKETCEDLAEFYNGNTARINEIVSFMINNDLFELSEITGRVTCNKLYKYLDSSQTRSDAIRGLIKSWKSQAKELGNGDCRDIIASETVSDKRDRLRQDKTRQEEDKDIIHHFISEWKNNNLPINETNFMNYVCQSEYITCFDGLTADEVSQAVKNYKYCVDRPEDYAPYTKKEPPHKFLKKMIDFTDAYEPIINKRVKKDTKDKTDRIMDEILKGN